MMRLKVLLPSETFVDTEVTKIIAEAENGAFCLLPRHVDFVAALVPSLLSYVPAGGNETFLAVDEGTLVKCGLDVFVSTRNAVSGMDLEHLHETVENTFKQLSDQEKMARSALARLEAGVVRGFIELRE